MTFRVSLALAATVVAFALSLLAYGTCSRSARAEPAACVEDMPCWIPALYGNGRGQLDPFRFPAEYIDGGS